MQFEFNGALYRMDMLTGATIIAAEGGDVTDRTMPPKAVTIRGGMMELTWLDRDSPAVAVARHVLAHPHDRVGIAVLMDALQAWLEVEPSAERDKGRLAAEVRAVEYGDVTRMDGTTDRLRVLLDKLRTLGYGAGVDEYLRAAEREWTANGVALMYGEPGYHPPLGTMPAPPVPVG